MLFRLPQLRIGVHSSYLRCRGELLVWRFNGLLRLACHQERSIPTLLAQRRSIIAIGGPGMAAIGIGLGHCSNHSD